MNHYGIEDTPGPLFAMAPAVRGSVTSAAAADSLTPATLNAMQRRVYDLLVWRGETGATDEEMQAELEMSPNTQRPRRIELARRGMIVESGSTRRTASGRMAVVWKVTAASR
jgi:transcription initiation factor IIE alpha subunit